MRMRKWFGFCLLTGLLSCLPVYSFAAAEETEMVQETETTDETEELPDGQRKATIYIVEITGNELTYYEKSTKKKPDAAGKAENGGEAGASEDAVSGATQSEDAASGATQSGEGERRQPPQGDFSFPEGGTEEGERRQPPQGDFNPSEGGTEEGERRQPPQGDFSFPEGEMKDGEMPQMPQGDFSFPEGEMKDGEMPQMPQGDFAPGQKMQDTVTVYLSVAVPVYTDLGEKMTFSILEAGDEAEAVFEMDEDGTEVITELRLKNAEAL